MIDHISKVTGTEWRQQIRYLQEHSHVSLDQRLKTGHLILERGVISSREFLGECNTIFNDLGGLRAIIIYQRELFRVAEVNDILHREGCNDPPSRKRYDELVEKIGNGSQQPNITIARPEVTILDGNKSAAAYHDLHMADDEIELHVYLVRPRAPGD
jgi:hypothetical protein